MSRNLILATGALLWAIVAIDAIVHIASGDWIAPALMVIAGSAWVAARWPRQSLAEAA
jgi:hypothetical protein